MKPPPMSNEPQTLRSITDSDGTVFIINSETRAIISSRDKYGFMYDSQGKRVGNINENQHFLVGYDYN